MSTTREPVGDRAALFDPTPMPSDIPDVPEVGATSAPLKSAAYFIGARCLPYNDDFMLCKKEADKPELDCLKEGRRVTRCAISVLEDINKYVIGSNQGFFRIVGLNRQIIQLGPCVCLFFFLHLSCCSCCWSYSSCLSCLVTLAVRSLLFSVAASASYNGSN